VIKNISEINNINIIKSSFHFYSRNLQNSLLLRRKFERQGGFRYIKQLKLHFICFAFFSINIRLPKHLIWLKPCFFLLWGLLFFSFLKLRRRLRTFNVKIVLFWVIHSTIYPVCYHHISHCRWMLDNLFPLYLTWFEF